MSRCWRGHQIDPRYGFCRHWLCDKAAEKPDLAQSRMRAFARSDPKRCPFCTGEQGKKKGPCWISACDRGPGGRRCDCHPSLTPSPSPGTAPQRRNAFAFARTLL